MKGRTEPAIIVWLQPVGWLLLLVGLGLMAKTFKNDDFAVRLPGAVLCAFGLISVVTRVPSSEPTNLFAVNGHLLDVIQLGGIFLLFALSLVVGHAIESGDMLKILSVIAFFAGLLFLIYIGVLLSRLGKWVGWEIAHWREAK
jgi:hypothetical protein